METKGLLFIPDISGFTRFVTETEIAHSKLIIQELLELLINANEIKLEISEVEGDAILFYRFGECPDMDELYRQVQKMFCSFHAQLAAYEIRRFCQCKACVSAIHLTLKIITHYGEFTGYNVKTFSKLIGKDIIVAHQLLKNDIEQHEYWLVTRDLLQGKQPEGITNWMNWNNGVKQTETGNIPFHYTALGPLKNELQPVQPARLELDKKIKVFSRTAEYPTHIIQLFHAAGDFSYRSRWREGVQQMEEMSHYLPRVGMKGRLLKENGETTIFTSSYSFQPGQIEFSETDEKTGFLTYYTLEKLEESRTRLTVDYYIPKSLLARMAFILFQKKDWGESLNKSLKNLEVLVKDMHVAAEY